MNIVPNCYTSSIHKTSKALVNLHEVNSLLVWYNFVNDQICVGDLLKKKKKICVGDINIELKYNYYLSNWRYGSANGNLRERERESR